MNKCLCCDIPLSDPAYRFCSIECQSAYVELEHILLNEHRRKVMSAKPAAEAVRKLKPAEKERLKKAGKSTAPFEEESRARPLSDFPDLEDVLPDLIAEYRQLQETIKAAEARKKEIADDAKILLEGAEAESITGDGWNCCVVRQERSSLKKELLLQHGVSMDVIDASTETKESSYIQVREVK